METFYNGLPAAGAALHIAHSSQDRIASERRLITAKEISMQDTLCRIIGLGNVNRGDDSIGPIVARKVKAVLAERFPDLVLSQQCEVTECSDGAGLLAEWDGVPLVVVIDAMVSGAPPATVRRFAPPEPLPVASFMSSTHAFGLAEAIALGDVLHQLPDAIVVYGIEGHGFDVGSNPSPEVLAVVGSVAERVIRDVVAVATDALMLEPVELETAE